LHQQRSDSFIKKRPSDFSQRNNTMAQLRFSELSAPRQAFIRRCQRLGFGIIRGLEVRDCEPAIGPKTDVLLDLKLDSDEDSRAEQDLRDFVVCKEIRRLLSTLDSIRNGVIDQVEIRAGVPRRAIYKTADPMHR
jgi:hypothetical protein